MLITVPSAASATLQSLLSSADLQAVRSARSKSVKVGVLIQNLGSQNIFIEAGTDATISDGIRIATDEAMDFNDYTLGDINLISESAPNTNVRIIVN